MNQDRQLTAAEQRTADRRARLRRTLGAVSGGLLVTAIVVPPMASKSIAHSESRLISAVTDSGPVYSQELLASYVQQPEPITPGGGADSAIEKVDPQIMGNGEVRAELEKYVNRQAPHGMPLQPNEGVFVPVLPPSTSAHK